MLESAIERRNFYQGRMIDAMVNIVYFTQQLKELKPDTQERIDAKNAIKEAQRSVANDEKLMEAFDILMGQLAGDRIVKTNPTTTNKPSRKE